MGLKRTLTASALVGCALMSVAGTVSYYEESLPSTLNPLFARTMVDHRSIELVFDRLYYRSAITNELKSRLVASHEVLGDGKQIRLVLREGVKWHDGKTLGPEDICFTVAAMLDPKTPSTIAKEYRESLAKCEPFVKENAALITFTKAFHNPRERIAFAVLPKHGFPSTAITPDLEFSNRPVGTGPTRGSKGRREVKFAAFPNAHHAPGITEMVQAEGGDPFVQVRTLLNAGVQGVISVSPQLRPEVAASDDVALKSYDLRSWWFVAMNTQNGPLKDRRIRAAIDAALDRDALRELTIGVDPNDPNPPCEFVSGPFVQSSPYYNRSIKVRPKADLAQVKALMGQAGAVDQHGRWILNGAPVTLRLGMNGPLDVEAKDLLNQIGNQLQAAGFDRQVFRVSSDDWSTKAVTGGYMKDYEMLVGKWSFGVVEDVNPMFQTRLPTGQGALNVFNYSNKEVDATLARFDAARTDTEAQDAYHDLHQLLSTEFPYAFLWRLDTKSAWRNEVRSNTIAPYFYFTEFDSWKF